MSELKRLQNGIRNFAVVETVSKPYTWLLRWRSQGYLIISNEHNLIVRFKVVHMQVHKLRICEIECLLLQDILSGHLHLTRNRGPKEEH